MSFLCQFISQIWHWSAPSADEELLMKSMGGCYSGCSVYLYKLLLKVSKYWCVWVSVSSRPLGFVLVFVFLSCWELASLMFLFACWYVVIAVLYHTCCCWNTLNLCVCVCVCVCVSWLSKKTPLFWFWVFFSAFSKFFFRVGFPHFPVCLMIYCQI